MAALERSSSVEPAAEHRRGGRTWRGRALAIISVTLIVLSVTGALAAAGGFFWFLGQVSDREAPLLRDADGIVVLTGGTSRIADAIELLAAGHGKRLLITGAHPTTSQREIARLMPRYERWIECCVDLDHSALNTFGNAAETRRWIRSLNFESLIVVTSNYHMPRSMAELAHALPEIRLIQFPVISDKVKAEPWWSSPTTARLLLSEFVKYIVVQARIRLDPVPEQTGLVRSARQ